VTYLKCTSCKARLYSVATFDRLGGELCPACGAVLEPVGELAELFGYRSIEAVADPTARPVASGVVVNRFTELLAARQEREAAAALEAELWLDDRMN
jgi:hypothetical protein